VALTPLTRVQQATVIALVEGRRLDVVHEYKRKRPTKNVQALLDYIETSGDPIFWG
jgi:hypothetical protein